MESFGMSSLGRQNSQAGLENSLVNVHNRIPVPSNLHRFYSSNDDPWTPSGLVQPAAASDMSHGLNVPDPQRYLHPTYDFSASGYRSVGQPSECGTLPPDSGYGGSGPAYSVEESASTILEDDRGFDSQQISDQFTNTFHLGGESRVNQMETPFNFYCNDCRTPLRTQSELNKHTQRHQKPHRCTYPNCPRALEGFSTSNDLQRHKRTVHSERDGKKYICHHGNCQKKPAKKWPRADNFRSHLLRVHNLEVQSDSDLSQYLCPSSSSQLDFERAGAITYAGAEARPNDFPGQFDVSSQPLRALTDTSKSPSDESENISLTGFALQSPLSGNRNFSASSPSREDQMQYIQPDILQGPNGRAVSEIQARDNVAGQSFMEDLHRSDGGNDTTLLETNGMDDSLTRSETHETSQDSYEDVPAATPMGYAEDMAPQASTSDSESKDILLCDSFTDLRANDPRILEFLKSIPKDLLETALKAEAVGDSIPKAQHECTECHKPFRRPCELKKHMKRHEKPYGCTFRSCPKTFGSKNDWKRHESSQHFQLETWNCDEEGCKKICQRRESFKNHLTRDHDVKDSKLVEEKLDKCRTGRHCATRFWCGFCLDNVDIQEEGVNWWTKRCDHIDNHLFGKENLKKKSIEEWVHLEEMDEKDAARNSSAGQQPPPPHVSLESNKPNGRKRKFKGDVNRRHQKKPTLKTSYMWICCNCSDVMSVRNCSSCVQCGHQKCELDSIDRVDRHDSD